MSEILLRLDAKSGHIKIEVRADDYEDQLSGIKRLPYFLKAINELNRRTVNIARLYNLFTPGEWETDDDSQDVYQDGENDDPTSLGVILLEDFR